jgi:hypothetical protein
MDDHAKYGDPEPAGYGPKDVYRGLERLVTAFGVRTMRQLLLSYGATMPTHVDYVSYDAIMRDIEMLMELKGANN